VQIVVCAEELHTDLVAAVIMIVRAVQRLVQITHEMDEEAQRLSAFFSWARLVLEGAQ
jgi:hypothetical protein